MVLGRLRLGAASRGVLAITSGTLVGQIIVAVATPFLSRMYPPEAFGAFSTVLAVASAIGPATALKFDSAILLPKKEADARNLLGLAILSTTVVAVLSGIVMAFLGPVLLPGMTDAIPFAALWIGALILTTGLFTSLVQAALRSKSYGLVGWRSAIQSIGTTVAQLSFGLLGPSPSGLLGGALLGRLLGFGALARSLRPLLAARGGASMRQLAHTYWRSPVVLAPSSLLNALGSQLPLILLSAWFGAGAAGQLGMAQRLVFLPAALIGAALAQVFGAEIAQRLRDGAGSSRALYLRATWRISAVAVPMCTLILVLSPWALPWILGADWEASGYLAQGMAISASVSLIVSPLSQVYTVHQSVASLAIDASRVALILGAGAIALALGLGVVETVWVIYGAQVVNYIATWLYGLRIVSRKVSHASRDQDLPEQELPLA
ncbi:lipopolysaccharide biosynthesis protein [Microbacterium sp. PMB16]|uniref:lipopolysaccharide biosynthesis protein n=1 Tax=Microbacterium sp. PMB16 TaxID=3120157 RepID=UPI003F4C701C